MAMHINDDSISLEINGATVKAAVRLDNLWRVTGWPRLLTRNEAITALVLAERLLAGYGGGDDRGHVEGDQVGDGQQQPGHGGVDALGPGGEVDDGGGRQSGVAAGGGRADAGPGLGAAQQPAESFLAQDVADGRAAQGRAFPGEPGADLVDRQALAAQLDDAGTGSVLFWRALAARHARRREQGEPACPQVTHQGGQRGAGIASGLGGLLQRRAPIQVGAQRLITPLVHLARAGEQLPSPARGRYCGHAADLPHGHAVRRYPARAR
jgi:hypothetical protein